MTLRQSLLKTFYPLLMMGEKFSGRNQKFLYNNKNIKPGTSFYSLKAITNSGAEISFDQFKGKKILLVNTASDCGFTGQYEELQKLHEQYKDNLIVIGFPSNDFKEQEKGSDEEIANFCKINYGVSFLIMKKSIVTKHEGQSEMFRWLTDKTKNGWSNKAPSWNFSKYIVNEIGVLTHYFGPSVSPLDDAVIDAIKTP